MRMFCDEIHCFKEGEPCSNRRDLLKQQLEIINDNKEDPFKLVEPTEEDREAAHPAILLVDEDSDADADIDMD